MFSSLTPQCVSEPHLNQLNRCTLSNYFDVINTFIHLLQEKSIIFFIHIFPSSRCVCVIFCDEYTDCNLEIMIFFVCLILVNTNKNFYELLNNIFSSLFLYSKKLKEKKKELEEGIYRSVIFVYTQSI